MSVTAKKLKDELVTALTKVKKLRDNGEQIHAKKRRVFNA